MSGAYSESVLGRGHQISSLFQAQFFPGRVILSNLSNKNDFRGSGGMLPRKFFENLHTVMVILASDGIQNFKNRFSFVSYLLTIGSLIMV